MNMQREVWNNGFAGEFCRMLKRRLIEEVMLFLGNKYCKQALMFLNT